MERGSNFNHGSDTGVFSFGNTYGNASGDVSFRVLYYVDLGSKKNNSFFDYFT